MLQKTKVFCLNLAKLTASFKKNYLHRSITKAQIYHIYDILLTISKITIQIKKHEKITTTQENAPYENIKCQEF